MGPSGLSTRERIMRHIIKSPSGCWLWRGTYKPNGYAQTSIKADGKWRTTYVHRLMFEWHCGRIPVGRELDHLCRVRGCVNPRHLEVVTRRENILRGDGPKICGYWNREKTHCKNGHPFDEQNTRLRPTGGRACRECAREQKERQRLQPNYHAVQALRMREYRARRRT